jgi:hypothetical protein
MYSFANDSSGFDASARYLARLYGSGGIGLILPLVVPPRVLLEVLSDIFIVGSGSSMGLEKIRTSCNSLSAVDNGGKEDILHRQRVCELRGV